MLLAKLPSLNSYQGRYFYFGAFLAIALAITTWYGHHHVSEASNHHIARIQNRSVLLSALSQLNTEVNDIEDQLYWQLIEPDNQRLSQIKDSIEALNATLYNNIVSLNSQGHAEIHTVVQKVLQDAEHLSATVEQFIKVSSNIDLRFPGVMLMELNLLPESTGARLLLNYALLDISGYDHNRELIDLIYQMRENWQMLPSEFRLLVANRFGVFSDTPQAGIQGRMENIQMIAQQLEINMNRAEKLYDQLGVFPVDDQIWVKLRGHAKRWLDNVLQIMDTLSADDWRRDLYLYRTEIKPLLQYLKSNLTLIGDKLNSQATSDIKDLTQLAAQLSDGIRLLAVIAMILLVSAYYYLKHRIIRPIAETTLALKQEANGAGHHDVPIPKLEEPRNLIDAFHEMRLQVWRRQERLDHLAHHDPLTNLPNRVLLKDRLGHALDMASRYDQTLALMFIDLDNFKQINDSLGHLAGDLLLEQVAARLVSAVRPSDTVARISGDEFAILAEDIGTVENAARVAQNILASLQPAIRIDGNELHITCSIGIALAPDDDTDITSLMRDADAAMYEAKRLGRARHQFFTAELTEKVQHRMELEQRLRIGADNGEFCFYFQPVLNVRDGSLHCLEALIRWRPEGMELQRPEQFLPTLLEMGLGAQISKPLLASTARLQSEVEAQHGLQIPVALNISANMLRNQEYLSRNLQTLLDSGIPLERLIIEVTEDCLVEDINFATQLFDDLKAMGVRIALDDFGTGQSSLNHLRSYQFDIIKVDREFTRNLTYNKNDAGLVKAIIDLSHQLGAEVVAEGIETPAQMDVLRAFQCDHVQGYLISKPLPEDELKLFIAEFQRGNKLEKSSTAG